MTQAGDEAPDPYIDALVAARLCAIDPALGGMVLRGGGGELRDSIVAELRVDIPIGAPVRRMPSHIDDDRLLGGIDLTATLAHGAAVSRTGLLAEASGGVVVVPMAERLSDATAGRIATVLDTGELLVERNGVAGRHDARFILVALDDGIEPDERPATVLMERTAFWLDLSSSQMRLPSTAIHIGPVHQRQVAAPPDMVQALVATAAALGIGSARATMFALRAARASARLAGRDAVLEADILLAARLVLAPRATCMPQAAGEAAPEPPPPESRDGGEEQVEPGALDDVVLAATMAALPKDVLAQIASGAASRNAATGSHGSGRRRKSPTRGRPLAARAGLPGGGRRLSLIDTLRAAAPWQALRGGGQRIQVRRDDLRIRRFETRAQALTIFAVDASGSAALARLAEAKGAVELLLAEAYVKRTQVALLAFRGTAAELLLPPTRSLARARRSLAELPGGGGTPLAAGLNAARDLAMAAKARGQTPFIVVLTDGRANIAADGGSVRKAAEADADAAAKAIGAAGIAAVFVDISARPRSEGAELAAAMRARYLPLPRADAAAMHAAVSAVQRQ